MPSKIADPAVLIPNPFGVSIGLGVQGSAESGGGEPVCAGAPVERERGGGHSVKPELLSTVESILPVLTIRRDSAGAAETLTGSHS